MEEIIMKAKKILALTLLISVFTSTFTINMDAYAEKNHPKKNYKIHLKGAKLEPGSKKQNNNKSLAKKSNSELKPYLITFSGIITDSMKEEVKKADPICVPHMTE